ncbi:MAG: hypothetical protein A2087_09715 [Spirochaetes bacterium GWD1_61_31]|nr:MAG: hypothetical protein A2Y37_10200 [Spirochaetes bacterium GWB1_60_80]OHD29047.1 MAG: hypothetical protein A2004_14440 [Spirochaetes bacterium GWC1_61_12]OHD35589.1 MAG: hypothetical protein A2087_09715 [Spirochaetes bacterium GWD1_61_31]OHD44214.1 MAG: hypothetical protein A2Y35_06645 [Spirochaetes bacterium GWE1_60_18]OHD60426.1 MAG: hypothetical protein A2Y32_00880 [Spirochaetes bacterium GWF1_60_12]HAP44470.1 serine/threonine protein kinase [Spirochaetaceae bacterium]
MIPIDPAHGQAAFGNLTPQLAMSVVEEGWHLRCDGSFFAYPSYINRVYGLRSEDGDQYVVKFYRPGRWTEAAIRDEHRFLAQLAEAEVPVIPPILDADGDSLLSLVLDGGSDAATSADAAEIHCALFAKTPGRSFDADSLDDMERLGSLAGRIHAVGATGPALARLVIQPGLASGYVQELLQADVIHPDALAGLVPTLTGCAAYIDGQLADYQLPTSRLHGDFHRGNILDRGGGSLVAVDFDDMCCGPAILDLWMLLPDRPAKCPAERDALLAGYERFRAFDATSFGLVPALQLLRIIHYLAWQCRQRHDQGFQQHFPGWGGRGFWLQEAEDLACRLAEPETGQ